MSRAGRGLCCPWICERRTRERDVQVHEIRVHRGRIGSHEKNNQRKMGEKNTKSLQDITEFLASIDDVLVYWYTYPWIIFAILNMGH